LHALSFGATTKFERSRMNLPPLDVLLYARSRPDPRERLLILTAVRAAFPALQQDPDWSRQIEALREGIRSTLLRGHRGRLARDAEAAPHH
jgi:hypothetical protein